MHQNPNAEIRPELNLSVEEAFYSDRFFIADRVFPMWPSETKLGEYAKERIRSGGLMKKSGDSDQTKRAPGTAYKRISGTHEKDTFDCEDRGLEEPVDVTTQLDLSRFLDAERSAAKRVSRQMRRDYEARVAAEVMSPSNFGTALSPSADYTEDNEDHDTTPIDFLKDAQKLGRLIEDRGELANAVVLSRNVADRIALSTKLATRIFGSNHSDKMLTMNIVQQFLTDYFNTPITVFVAGATYDSSKKKSGDHADADLKYIWGDDYVWMGCVAEGAPEMGGAGRTICWTQDAAGLFVTESYYEERYRSNAIRVRQHTDEKVVNENCGALLTTNFA